VTPWGQAGSLALALALTGVPLVLSGFLLLWAGRQVSQGRREERSG
jgi:hypothetical protein